MLSQQILQNIKTSARYALSSRNIGVFAPCLNKAQDPIQQLFVDKLREYRQKSDGGKKLVEPSPEIEKELKSELEKVTKQFGGGPNVDLTKFPEFKFDDVKLDPISFEEKQPEAKK